MSTQLATVPKGSEGEGYKEFTLFDALSFEPKEPSMLMSWEELQQQSTSKTTAAVASKSSLVNKNHNLQKPLPPNNSQLQRTFTKSVSMPNMSVPKAQTLCLERCHKTTTQIDHIAVRFLESLTSERQLPQGFNTLAHDFLDSCQILFSIEAGLSEYNSTGRKFPPELIAELDNKFRVAQTDFRVLDQVLLKHLGASGLKRSWGKLFGDTDIHKVTTALARTRESLKMSSLVFQWSLGQEAVEREMGIGYAGLSAALDRMDRKGVPSAGGDRTTNGKTGDVSQRPLPLQPAGPLDQDIIQQQQQQLQQLQQQLQQQQLHQQQNQPTPSHLWAERSDSMHHEVTTGRASGNEFRSPLNLYRPPLSPEIRQHIVNTARMSSTASTASITDDHPSSYLTGITESDSFLDDVNPSNVVRITVDPRNVPRGYPRNVEPDTPHMRAALITAIQSKDYKLVEKLLSRGIVPDIHALREAITAHDEDIVQLLLYFGADPNKVDRDGITPLLASVQLSFLLGSTALLKYGADPNLVSGPDLESPLAVAVSENMVGAAHLLLTYNGDANHLNASGTPLLTSAIKKKTPKRFIELLLGYGAEPNTKSREGKTALFEALQVGRADIVTALLDNGADPNLPGPKHMLWPSTFYPACLQVLLAHGADHKKTPGIMELAASINNIESLQILLKAGVDPNTKKDGIYTPLCTAIRDDRADLLQLLLSNGASPNTKASEYPCFKCVTHDRVHFLPILVAAGGNLNEPKGILETAVSSNNIEALNWLLDQGVNPNDKSPKGMTPLTTAIRDDRKEMVDLLLMRGADPHMRGEDWPICMAVNHPSILKGLLTVIAQPQAFKGVMEMAVSANQLESVKLLLAAGVSVEDKNGGVFSPLTTALRENRREIVRFLLDGAGADVNAPGEHLPVVKALRRFHGEDTEMLELLLEHGADPNKLYRGWNGIMQAVENGDADVLRLVSQRAGVDIKIKDDLGRTVVEMAASRGWDEAVQILTNGVKDEIVINTKATAVR